MLLRSLNCADGAGISAAKKEITTLEGALQHQHHHLRPLSLDRRQVRHHRLPGGAGHPPPDRGHLDPGGHGHSLRLLRQHRQPRPGQAHQRGVHRPDCQRSPPANAGSRLAGRQGRLPMRTAGLKSSDLWVPPGIDGVSPLSAHGRHGRLSEKPPRETEVLHRKSPESRILQKKLGNPFRSQAAALCNMLFL